MPSLHTGAQTAKKRKAGSRLTSKYAFIGEGSTLCYSEQGKGTGYGKRANRYVEQSISSFLRRAE